MPLNELVEKLLRFVEKTGRELILFLLLHVINNKKKQI